MNRNFMSRIFFVIVFVNVFATGAHSQEWKNRKDWPAEFPKPPFTKKRLFYLQRNLNKNTIVYDVNLSEDGKINPRKPIDVYWMRYGDNAEGTRKGLSWVQRKFAYGYKSKLKKSGNDNQSEGFVIKLVAYGERNIDLEEVGQGIYRAVMQIDGVRCQLTHIYVFADESGFWPNVLHVDIFGEDLKNGKQVKERILN